MQDIHKVAILGAGGMGAYFATQFLEVDEITTSVVARGRRAKRLAEHGLVVNGQTYSIPVSSPDEVNEPADLIQIQFYVSVEFGCLLA